MEPELYEADKPIKLPGARKRKLLNLSFKIFLGLIFIIFAYRLTTTVQHTTDNKTQFILKEDQIQDICLGW